MAIYLTTKCYDVSRPLTNFHDYAAVHVRSLLFWYVAGLGWQPLTDISGQHIGPETPATTCQPTPRNIPEDRRSQGD